MPDSYLSAQNSPALWLENVRHVFAQANVAPVPDDVALLYRARRMTPIQCVATVVEARAEHDRAQAEESAFVRRFTCGKCGDPHAPFRCPLND